MLLFNYKMTAEEAYQAGLISRLFTKEEMKWNVWKELEKHAAELPSNVNKYFYFISTYPSTNNYKLCFIF